MEERIDIKTIGAGDSFGEMALMNNKPRAASIVCLTDCDFIILDKASFNKLVSKRLEDGETMNEYLFTMDI